MALDLAKLTEHFPKEVIKQREGHNGKMLDYFETHIIITRLNEAFAGAWSFRVVEMRQTDKEVIALCELQAEGIIKQQHGQTDIHFKKNSTEPVCLGDDFKAAASDGLKKCATLFGVGLQLYEEKTAKKQQTSKKQKPAPSEEKPSGEATGKPASASGNGNGTSTPSGGNGASRPRTTSGNSISQSQIKEVKRVLEKLEMDEDVFNKWLGETFERPLEDLSYEQGGQVIAAMRARLEEAGA